MPLLPRHPGILSENRHMENLKKALRAGYEESVWDYLTRTAGAPFTAREHGQVAVEIIDQRGDEFLVVKSVKEAGK